ncbi:DNA polymerase [Streptomyces sp. NPDC021100]|uniref:DNA polymerase n=1 Tax=Streptomyces sp. NPDC021100 TaxID=3365114 RepID=UPI0037B53327
MTAYTRTHAGHTMTVHAPRDDAEFDPAAFAAFAASDVVLGLDVETRAIEDGGPGHFGPGTGVRLVQFGTPATAWVLNPLIPAQREAIERVLADPGRRFVTHTNYDTLAIWSAFGIALGQRVVDTHLLSKLINPDERAGHGLKDLTLRHLDDGLVQAREALYGRMRELAPTGSRAGNTPLSWGWTHIPADDETYVVYAGLDAVYVRRLLPLLLARCAPVSHLVVMEQWLAAQSTGITVRGLLLDRPYTQHLLDHTRMEFDQAAQRIRDALGFPGASPRFAEWLAGQVEGVELPRTATGRPQVTADVLTQLHQDIAAGTARITEQGRELLEARRAMAATSNTITNLRSFLAAADGADRVHPQINTLRAKTGRMSITSPALQTLKKHDPRLRHCFRADAGHVLVACDFSQVEVRVAAALSRDPTLMDVIASGTDLHDATATLMYGPGFTKEQRTVSKRATFGTIYGGGAKALAAQTGVPVRVARGVIQRWQRTYPEVIRFGKTIANATTVITGSGRRIPADPDRPYANSNYAIQSTARDLLVAAVYELATVHDLSSALWLFVHDEVIVQVPEHDAMRVRDLLTAVMTTSFRGVPIAADAEILGTHWGRLPEQEAPPVPVSEHAGA